VGEVLLEAVDAAAEEVLVAVGEEKERAEPACEEEEEMGRSPRQSGEGLPAGYGRALPVLLPGRAMEESAPSLDAPAVVGRRGERRRRRWRGRAQGRGEAARG
jgi:hypothetical protein